MLFQQQKKKLITRTEDIVSKLNSADIQNKGNKSKPDDWRFISVILIGTFSSSSRLKFPTQFFSHVRTSSRVSLVEMVTILCAKLQRTSIFFYLSLILSMFLNTQKKNFPLQCEVNISPFSELLQFAFYSFQFQSPSKTVWFEKRNVFQHKTMAKSKDCSNSEVKHARSLNWEVITLNCN